MAAPLYRRPPGANSLCFNTAAGARSILERALPRMPPPAISTLSID